MISTQLDLETVFKQIRELKDENNKLHATRQKLEFIPKQVDKIIEELQKLKDFVGIPTIRGKGERTPSDQITEAVEECFEKLKAGTHITTDSIAKSYPDFSYPTYMRIMQRLKEIGHVHSTKDGVKLRLFYDENKK